MSVEKRYRKELGDFLKKSRRRAEVTQMDVARRCGFKNAQFISNIERGTCWPPTYILVEMSELYGISKTELLEKLVYFRKKVWAFDFGLTKKSNFK